MCDAVQIAYPGAAYCLATKVTSRASTMPVQNRLLQELPGEAFNIIHNECALVELTTGDVLYEPGERIRNVYFPTQSVISLVAKAAGNASLEVALVSDEGMVGIPLLLGADSKS